MKKIQSLVKWLIVDTFPFPLLPLFLIIHIGILFLFSDATTTINKYASNLLQFVGLIVVIKAVNDNVRIVDRSSVIASIKKWLNSFPLKKRNITIEVGTASILMSAGRVKARVIRKTKTLDEKVNFAFEEIERLERELENSIDEFDKKIDELKKSMDDFRTGQSNDLNEIKKRLSDVFVGGAKEELFGIACIFYSLIASFFT
jgi:hypothetical protein